MTATIYLLLATLGLFMAPIIYAVVERSGRAQAALGGFILSSICLLAFGHILPNAMEIAGPGAIGLLILGFLLPIIIEKLNKNAKKSNKRILVALATLGLLSHAFLDGIGLQVADDHHAQLSAAIAIHKLPVGLMIWWILKPLFGWGIAAIGLGAVTVATLSGFLVQNLSLDPTASAYISALVAGTLLHVVASDHGPKRRGRFGIAETVGALMGIALVIAIPEGHHHGPDIWHAVGERLYNLALETAPALFLGFVLAGLVVAFLPRMSTQWLAKGGNFTQASRGLFFGLPIPICSCGVVPLYESLLKRGVPPTAAMAFLIATPELGLDSLILTLPLLGGPFTGIRLVAATLLALVVAVLVPRFVGKMQSPSPIQGEVMTQKPLGERLKEAMHYGLKEVVDDTAPWILFGLFVAALIPPALLSQALTQMPTGLDVVAATLVGIPFYICASGATPLAAALIYAGLSPGAGLAFLLAGPATNITTFGVLRRNHGQKTAVVFGGLVSLLAMALGFATNLVLGTESIQPPTAHGEHFGPLSYLAFGAVSLLFIASMLRTGPQAMLAMLVAQNGSDDGECTLHGCEDDACTPHTHGGGADDCAHAHHHGSHSHGSSGHRRGGHSHGSHSHGDSGHHHGSCGHEHHHGGHSHGDSSHNHEGCDHGHKHGGHSHGQEASSCKKSDKSCCD